MAADSGSYDQATLLRRQKIAEAMLTGAIKPRKIEHWAQGLAQLGEAGLGGYWAKQADDDVKAQKAQDTAALAALLGGGSAPATNPAPAQPQQSPAGGSPMVTPPMGNRVAQAMTTGKIYENDEPSPLDPPSGQDRDLAVRTMLAEAGNQGPTGLNAVGSVIRNRAVNGGFGGDTATGVVTARNQFEPWNTPEGRARMAAIDPNSPRYQQADQALTQAYAGNDPTNGATHFFAPKAQAALGRDAPKWGREGGVDIGDHRFFGGKGNAVAEAMTSAPAPSQGGVLAGATPQQIAAIRTGMAASEGSPARAIAQAMMTKLAANEAKDPLDIEAKKLDIEAKRKGLTDAPTVQRVKQPDGSEVAVQWDKNTQQWVPLKAPEGGNPVASPKLTEQQSKDVGFYNRGKNLLPRLEQQDQALTDFLSAKGGSVSNYLKTDEYRKAEQTGKELLAVILRKDTGAAVTPSEMEQYSNIYLPQPGDDAATVQQKRVARATAIEGLRMGLGPAEIIFKSREAAEAAKPAPAASAAPAPAQKPAAPEPGMVKDGWRFKGGDPSKKENWEQFS